MKNKVVRLTESDVERLVKKIIKEEKRMLNEVNIDSIVKKIKARGKVESHEEEKLMDYIKNKVKKDKDYNLNITNNGFSVNKRDQKKKLFGFDQIGKMVSYINENRINEVGTSDFLNLKPVDCTNLPDYGLKAATADFNGREHIVLYTEDNNKEIWFYTPRPNMDLCKSTKMILDRERGEFEEEQSSMSYMSEGEDAYESTRYMFFSNLEQMRRQAGLLLDLDEDQVNQILDNGHDWAQDHIAEAKNNMDQVFDFLMNETKSGDMWKSVEVDEYDMPYNDEDDANDIYPTGTSDWRNKKMVGENSSRRNFKK